MTDAADLVSEDRSGFGSLGTALSALVVACAAVIASFPLNDNSFFTHLATGRLILDQGSVPTSDPYTYTANGEAWTVQSWLPSVIYAAAEQLAGAAGLRGVVLAMLVGAALLVWRLTTAADALIVRLLIAIGAFLVGLDLWDERPYMVGVLGLGIVWLALEGEIRPWLLVPLLWVWGNSHGSYPLAVVLALAYLGGGLVDRRGGDAVSIGHSAVVVAATCGGIAAAIVGPLGFDVILFPLEALSQSDILQGLTEWQSPRFRSPSEVAFLALVVITFLALNRGRPWRHAIPAAVFVGLALYAQRNVVMATMVLVPVLAAALGEVGSLRHDARLRHPVPIVGASFAVAVAMSLSAVVTPLATGAQYPGRAIAWSLRQGGLWERRVAVQPSVGNYLEVLDGFHGEVFVDDRADMFPRRVFEDALVLDEGSAAWERVLADRRIGAVLWQRAEPLASLLANDARWIVAYSDTEWMFAIRRRI